MRTHEPLEKQMRHLEKIFIFTIMMVVLIYTVNVERDISSSRKNSFTVSTSPPPATAPSPQPVTKNEDGFFPESEPTPEDESIIEETFTEVP
jgi:hypothetical protein